MPNKHALLSASSSDRWIHCPPSARLSESYEDKGSDYAAEGTDAHSLCEYKLKAALGMDADDPTEDLTYYDQEMDDCATGYVSYVLEQVETAKENCSDPVVLIEQRIDFSRWVEQGFGTADCIVIADGTLQIIDFIIGHRKIHQDFIFITLMFIPVKINITTFNMSRNFIGAMRLLPFY